MKIEDLESRVDDLKTLLLMMDISQLTEKLNQASKLPIGKTKLLDITSFEILNSVNIVH